MIYPQPTPGTAPEQTGPVQTKYRHISGRAYCLYCIQGAHFAQVAARTPELARATAIATACGMHREVA